MTDPYDLHEEPELVDPVLVVMLTGWIDAGGAAQLAMSTLEDECGARTIAAFDPDTFIDFRARRPVMELRDGINSNLVWPTIELKAGRDADGHDVLLLSGHEPDSGVAPLRRLGHQPQHRPRRPHHGRPRRLPVRHAPHPAEPPLGQRGYRPRWRPG